MDRLQPPRDGDPFLVFMLIVLLLVGSGAILIRYGFLVL